METDRRQIEKKIAALRELIRCTLDRSAHPLMREKLVVEIEKLKALGGP
jgi:hypothetical protein